MVAAIEPCEGERADWSPWVGRREVSVELVSPDRVAALAATLDLEAAPGEGDRLPAGWHWLLFNPFVARRRLGVDGHPKRGGLLPPVALPRRMWAGGRIDYPGALVVGRRAERVSVIEKIESKTGGSGELVFVTVKHHIACDGAPCVVEEQDIVYRGGPAVVGKAAPAPADGAWRREVTPDPTLLFRYSALTSNGHRIHYDQAYARDEEGYPDLVVHGPLTATLLQNFASEIRPDARLARFEFRGVHPLFVNSPFSLEAKRSEKEPEALELWARGPSGELAMRASAHFPA